MGDEDRDLRSHLARLLRVARRLSKPRSAERARLVREMKQVASLAARAYGGTYVKKVVARR